MNLFQETKAFIRWTAKVTKQFLRLQASTTLFVVFSISVSRVCKLLAFFLPLKVILLVGSAGVPSYFPFIEPDQKNFWVFGLTIAAFTAYALMLMLNIFTDQYSEGAGKHILRFANQISISSKDEEQASKTFLDFTNMLAGLGFIGVGAIVLAWANPILLSFLLAVPLLIFVFSAWVLQGDALPFANTKKWLIGNTSTYLTVASSAAFFGAFLVILLLFLFGEFSNIILALLGIILSRQILNSMSGIANTACQLISKRPVVDAIFFRNVSFQTPVYKPNAKQFNALFSKSERELVAYQELARVMPLNGRLQSDWFDTLLRGIKTLNISVLNEKGDPLHHFQQHIVPVLNRDQLINEAHLFKHIPREHLVAPAVLTRFKVDDFECQILDCGLGTPVSKTVWTRVKHELLLSILSVKPPKALVSSYRRSKPLLADRLINGLTEQLEIAVDTKAEAELLNRWRNILPRLSDKLSSQPLCIYNVDLAPTNVVQTATGYLVMAWGRWSLEPLGAALQMAGYAQNGTNVLDRLKKSRQDLDERTWQGDLELAAYCVELEQAVNRQHYKKALSIIPQILFALDGLAPMQEVA